jgi:hypothetical protein
MACRKVVGSIDLELWSEMGAMAVGISRWYLRPWEQ